MRTKVLRFFKEYSWLPNIAERRIEADFINEKGFLQKLNYLRHQDQLFRVHLAKHILRNLKINFLKKKIAFKNSSEDSAVTC